MNDETLDANVTQREVELAQARNSITLKWGTLKGWNVRTDAARKALKKYHEDGVSFSAMEQRDTPKQREAILELIDCCDDIYLEWDDKHVSRTEAKEYILDYAKKREGI